MANQLTGSFPVQNGAKMSEDEVEQGKKKFKKEKKKFKLAEQSALYGKPKIEVSSWNSGASLSSIWGRSNFGICKLNRDPQGFQRVLYKERFYIGPVYFANKTVAH